MTQDILLPGNRETYPRWFRNLFVLIAHYVKDTSLPLKSKGIRKEGWYRNIDKNRNYYC